MAPIPINQEQETMKWGLFGSQTLSSESLSNTSPLDRLPQPSCAKLCFRIVPVTYTKLLFSPARPLSPPTIFPISTIFNTIWKRNMSRNWRYIISIIQKRKAQDHSRKKSVVLNNCRILFHAAFRDLTLPVLQPLITPESQNINRFRSPPNVVTISVIRNIPHFTLRLNMRNSRVIVL